VGRIGADRHLPLFMYKIHEGAQRHGHEAAGEIEAGTFIPRPPILEKGNESAGREVGLQPVAERIDDALSHEGMVYHGLYPGRAENETRGRVDVKCLLAPLELP